MRKRLRWNSGPVIRYLDYDFAAFQVQTHVNRAAYLRVLDCIVDEVHDDLLKVCTITVEGNASLDGGTKRNRLFLCHNVHLASSATDQFAEIQR